MKVWGLVPSARTVLVPGGHSFLGRDGGQQIAAVTVVGTMVEAFPNVNNMKGAL